MPTLRSSLIAFLSLLSHTPSKAISNLHSHFHPLPFPSNHCHRACNTISNLRFHSYRRTKSKLMISRYATGSWQPRGYTRDENSVYFRVNDGEAARITAIFFMGDQVYELDDEIVKRLSEPSNVCNVLEQKLGPNANIFVLRPTRYSGPFACYDHFIPSMTATGEPLGYPPSGYPACRHLMSHISNAVDHIGRSNASQRDGTSGDNGCMNPESVEHPWGSILLFGFSKGGVVLNQIMSELAYFAEEKAKPQEPATGDKTVESEHKEKLFPESMADLVSSLGEFHYVDAGLNCRGCHLTDPSILDGVAKAALQKKALRIVLHGTPRQWSDRRRPWILQEKDRFMGLVRKSEERMGGGKLSIEDKWYFEGLKPNLRMHFEIIEGMNLE